jgi:hypothetical protein
MVYQIEIAFDMRIVGSMTEIKDKLVTNAEKNNCEMHYINYEMAGKGRTIIRNHSVMTFIFPEEVQYIMKFIRFVKKYKHAKIESISCEDKQCFLLYASKKYQTIMERHCVKKYKESRHLLTPEQKAIIKVM